MRRSQMAAPVIGAALGALIAFLAQTTTEEQMGDCPTTCPPPPAGHATVLGILLGTVIGALIVCTAVFAVNRIIDRSLSDN